MELALTIHVVAKGNWPLLIVYTTHQYKGVLCVAKAHV
jgi:hypothetical protein